MILQSICFTFISLLTFKSSLLGKSANYFSLFSERPPQLQPQVEEHCPFKQNLDPVVI